MHTDQSGEAAVTTAQQRLLDGWRDVSRTIRKLAQVLGHAESCACGDAVTDTCRCGVSLKTQQECLQCAVLLHTVAWRIDELLDEAQWFQSTAPDVSCRLGEIESTTRTGALRGCVEALARTFEQIETLTRESSQGCNASCLPVIRRFADDLLVRCSALDEMLGFPPAASGRS